MFAGLAYLIYDVRLVGWLGGGVIVGVSVAGRRAGRARGINRGGRRGGRVGVRGGPGRIRRLQLIGLLVMYLDPAPRAATECRPAPWKPIWLKVLASKV
jgi:hypothetical protein